MIDDKVKIAFTTFMCHKCEQDFEIKKKGNDIICSICFENLEDKMTISFYQQALIYCKEIDDEK